MPPSPSPSSALSPHLRLPISPSHHLPYGAVASSPSSPTTTPLSSHPFCIATQYTRAYRPPDLLHHESCQPLRDFYLRQNLLLESMASISNYNPNPILSTNSHHIHPHLLVRRAILASNLCNGFLLLAQLYAFISSCSLALLAVFIDAILDMVSGLVVASTWYFKRRRDRIRYPVGRARLEPLGVIAMACLMTAATLVTLERSITALFLPTKHVVLTLSTASIVLSALAIKAALYFFCHTIDDVSVQALVEDHFNDCISNSASLASVVLAQHIAWWIDPLGGILISCLIIRNWAFHTLEHCDQLVGRVASPHVLNLITFVACTHSPYILQVDTVRAYHVGNGIYVEVHIVLDADMSLGQAHDIGESLQTRIETLDEVERCFVHLDVEALHSPMIEHKEI